MTTDSREHVLARVRSALADVTEGESPADHPVPRDYLSAHHPEDRPGMLDLLAENLADYRAVVHRATPGALPSLIAELLAARGSGAVAHPADLPGAWLAEAIGVGRVADGPEATPARLDTVDTVVTGCALAIAETGTIVLDAGPAQGRRVLTLVPDHHICVVRAGQVVASVPRALTRLDPTRPQTWISGPSATSDIELDRVEGVHGPRTLEVILVEERQPEKKLEKELEKEAEVAEERAASATAPGS
ncbi:lactate utilization protein C [Streptomyces sp. NA02950]|uniref:LutC/YkgG family protein n=1 Tax=Streptomyces sp. NA02950 TaxID=2742137 RepID=UPI0015910957|nr:lactate utilization protein C [Streptomyces sp. NA02950]QKV96228.1 lactate utilization protein C [Streptomyces sp. NA02950]